MAADLREQDRAKRYQDDVSGVNRETGVDTGEDQSAGNQP
jgi:hypothetical protein